MTTLAGKAAQLGAAVPMFGLDVEEVVGADRELELVGDVVPAFQVGEANAGLVVRDEFAAAVRAGVAVVGTIDRSRARWRRTHPATSPP